MRLIDADALREIVEDGLRNNPHKGGLARVYHNTEYAHFLDIICSMPIVDPPPNGPLALEELREMDGDKIYVHYIDGIFHDEDGVYFGKFEQLVQEYNGKLTACDFPLKHYGKDWVAYRRKPESKT